MKKFLIALIAILGNTLSASADNVVVKDITLQQGGTAIIDIELANPDKTYTAFQLDLMLPEGITPVTDEDGDVIIVNGSRLGNDHSIGYSIIEGGIRLVCVAASSAAINGTSGSLCIIEVKADATMKAGMSYMATATGVVFTTTNNRDIEMDDADFTIFVESSAQPGDLNGDGEVTKVDLPLLVRIVLNKETDYDVNAADVNQDNKVDIADVTALVNLIHE